MNLLLINLIDKIIKTFLPNNLGIDETMEEDQEQKWHLSLMYFTE